MELRNKILNKLKENRNKLSENSLKTYISCLFALYNKLEKGMKDEKGLDFFKNNVDEIIESIKKDNLNKRKTLLSALFILTNIEKYKEQMLIDCKTVNDIYKKNIRNEKEVENSITHDELNTKYNEYYNIVVPMLNNKKPIEQKTIMQFFILAFNKNIPPRRSLDYTLMKIRNFDVDKDNYYSKNKFVFNVYKTAKFYHRIEFNLLELNKELNDLIKKFIKINDNDYFFYSPVNNKPLTVVQFAQFSNLIWNKKVSTNVYRHLYINSFYSMKHNYSDYENLARLMGNSVAIQQTDYIKNDIPEQDLK
jgi:hypothetical protein